MVDVVAKVFSPHYRAIITSGLRCTIEAKRRFEITDLDLLKETHVTVSGGILLNGLYGGEVRLKLSAEHFKYSFGLGFDCKTYAEIYQGRSLIAYGVKQDAEIGGLVGSFTVKRQLPSSTLWNTSTIILADSNKGLQSEDLRSYLEYSDQIHSLVYTKCSISNDPNEIPSGLAFVLQKLPGTENSTLNDIYNEILANPLLHELERNFSYESVIELFPETESEQTIVQFKCTCSRNSVFDYLKMLNVFDIQDMIKQEQGVKCYICNEYYIFTQEELTDLIKQLSNSSPCSQGDSPIASI